MFTTFKSGLLMMIIPSFFSSLTTFMIALRDSFSDFAPVQTILPALKIKVAVFGIKHLFLLCSGCLNTLYKRHMLPVYRSDLNIPYFSLLHKIGLKDTS